MNDYIYVIKKELKEWLQGFITAVIVLIVVGIPILLIGWVCFFVLNWFDENVWEWSSILFTLISLIVVLIVMPIRRRVKEMRWNREHGFKDWSD